MMNGLVRRGWILLPGLALGLATPMLAQGSVTLSPTSLVFGNQVQGTTSAPQTVTLTNGTNSALAIGNIGATAGFVHTGGTCQLSPILIAKGASCTILMAFAPTTVGPIGGKLSVTDSASNSPQSATLSGTGIPPVALSTTSLTFAKLPEGETSPAQTVTLTNNQSTSLSFTSISTSGDFAIATNTCTGGVAALKSCSVGVTFTPTATGTRTGTLTFTDGAANSPQTVSLTGTGLAPALLSIAVTPGNAILFVGSSLQYTATGTYSSGPPKNLTTSVTWSVLPTGFASISATGLATGVAAGSTTVSAALGTIDGSTPLTVEQLVTSTGSLNTARYYHSATLLDTGLVLVAGGIGTVTGVNGGLSQLASAELYTPATGAFTYTGSLNTARDQQSATLLYNGSVLVAGGYGLNGELASAELYNPTTAAFTLTGSLNTPRYEHSAALLPYGSVLIAGGYQAEAALNSAEVYNPANGIFSYTGNLNTPRFDATATPLPDGTVLIAGGANATGALASAEIYNPDSGTFTLTGSLNVARSGATATLLNDGQVLIADGYNYLVTGALNSAELYNPATGVFTLTGSLASSAWLGTATLLNNGSVLMAGSSLNSAATEVFLPSTDTFSLSSPMLTPCDLQTATLLPDGAVLIAGGHSNQTSTVLSAAELYTPSALTPANLVSIAITPSNPSVAVNAGLQLIATGTFNNNSTQALASVTWTSSNPAVATVTNDATDSGVVYGVAAGAAVISACTGTLCATPATVTVP
jgi:hypothetical protein